MSRSNQKAVVTAPLHAIVPALYAAEREIKCVPAILRNERGPDTIDGPVSKDEAVSLLQDLLVIERTINDSLKRLRSPLSTIAHNISLPEQINLKAIEQLHLMAKVDAAYDGYGIHLLNVLSELEGLTPAPSTSIDELAKGDGMFAHTAKALIEVNKILMTFGEISTADGPKLLEDLTTALKPLSALMMTAGHLPQRIVFAAKESIEKARVGAFRDADIAANDTQVTMSLATREIQVFLFPNVMSRTSAVSL